MDGIIRRRGMGEESLPEWDYEWDYTMGKPDAIGWTRTSTGSVTSDTITANGLSLKTGGSNSYVFYAPPTTASSIYVCEAVVTITNSYGSGNYVQVAQIRTGNSTNSCFLVFTQDRKIRLYNASAIANGTQVSTYTNNTEYTVRLVVNGAVAQVYINGTKVGGDLASTNMTYPGGSRFGSQNTNGQTSVWKSYKLKIGRL